MSYPDNGGGGGGDDDNDDEWGGGSEKTARSRCFPFFLHQRSLIPG